MNLSLIIIGAGGHAISVTNVALSCGYSVTAYVDDNKSGTTILDVPVISTEFCYSLYTHHNYFVAIGKNDTRERVVNKLKMVMPNAQFPSLIHQSSVIGISSKVGEGTVVMPKANVGPNSSVGAFCIINTSSSIDHDCYVKGFASLAPGVITGGNVKIGLRSAISIGTTIKHGVSIGDDTVVGASSYVNKNIEDKVVAYGTPCKTVRSRKAGDGYLS